MATIFIVIHDIQMKSESTGDESKNPLFDDYLHSNPLV